MPEALRSRVAAVARLDSDWRIAAASPAFCTLLGRNAADVIGHSFLEFTEAQADWFAGTLAADLPDDDGTVTHDFQITTPSGETFWVRAVILLSAAEDGTLFPNEISLVEIEDLRQYGSEQARQVAILDRMLMVVDSAFWVSRMSDGKSLYVSPAFERIWGGGSNKLESDASSWMDQIHPDDRSRVETEVRRKRAARRPFAVEYRIIRSDGSMRWIWDKGMPAHNLFGNVDVYIGSAQDITERKIHEIELARRQAANNIDMMAADLAHNFNNLLAIVDLAAHAIQRADQSATHAERLESIHNAVERGSDITKLLLTISSRQDLNPTYVDLNEIVTEIKPLVAASMGVNHRLIYDVSTAPCPVQIDRTGLNQALLNLIKNSREAMPDGGQLLIQTRVLPTAAPLDGEDSAASYVQISIEDSGTGMTEHALRHATDPYFTTKPDGSGFGLAITNGFVKQSGGHLTLANRIGGGLVVRMTFPLALPPADPVHAADDRTSLQARSLLVVDDEPEIAKAVGQLFEAEGYLTAIATSCRDAKRRLEKDRFDAVITDIALGSKSTGTDLALWVRDRHPAVKVVLMSGYASDKASIPADMPFIAKPFAPAELIRIVRSELEDGR